MFCVFFCCWYVFTIGVLKQSFPQDGDVYGVEGLLAILLSVPYPILIKRGAQAPHPLSLKVLAGLLTSTNILRGYDGDLSLGWCFFFSFYLPSSLTTFHIHTFPQTIFSFSFFADLLSEVPSISLLQNLSLWQLLFLCPLTLLWRCNDNIILFFLM